MSADLTQALREVVREIVREVLAEERAASQRDDLLTVEECARMASVEPATIREWIKRGRLPASKIGRRFYISRLALDDARKPVRNLSALSPEELATVAADRILGRLG